MTFWTACYVMFFVFIIFAQKKSHTGKPDLLRDSRAFAKNNANLLCRVQNLAKKHSPEKFLRKSLLFDKIGEWYQEDDSGFNNGIRTLLWAYECMSQKTILNWDDCTVEHVLPIAWTDEWCSWDEKDAEMLKNTLGNFVLLSERENSRCKNKAFEKKKKIYEKSTFTLAKSVSEQDNWTTTEIESHADYLFNWIHKTFVAIEDLADEDLTAEDLEVEDLIAEDLAEDTRE